MRVSQGSDVVAGMVGCPIQICLFCPFLVDAFLDVVIDGNDGGDGTRYCEADCNLLAQVKLVFVLERLSSCFVVAILIPVCALGIIEVDSFIVDSNVVVDYEPSRRWGTVARASRASLLRVWKDLGGCLCCDRLDLNIGCIRLWRLCRGTRSRCASGWSQSLCILQIENISNLFALKQHNTYWSRCSVAFV